MYRELSSRLGFEHFNYFYNISLKNKYLYVETPKVACSFLKGHLGAIELVEAPIQHQEDYIEYPHRGSLSSAFIRPYQLGADIFDFQIGDLFKFCFVRNPFRRAMSAYSDKVVNGAEVASEIYRQVALLRGVKSDDVIPSSVSFEEYLASLIPVARNNKIDPHFWPQSTHLCIDIVKYDRIFRLEKMPEALSEISELLKLPPVNHSNIVNKSINSDHWKECYDEQGIGIVKKLYHNDFTNFGYSFDIKDC